MAFGKCGVCSQNQAKYKCPKTSVEYCSLPCFKNIGQVETASVPEPTEKAVEMSNPPQNDPSDTPQDGAAEPANAFDAIAKDPVIQSLLKYKALRVHLGVVLQLLHDSQITKEPLYENRREIANMRLCDLRVGGAEENELVEEFVQRVLFLQQESDGRNAAAAAST